MTASNAHRALSATITRLADHHRTAEARTYMDVAELRHLRPTQQQVLDAAMIKRTRRENRLLIGYGAALLFAFALALTAGHAITSAMTASIAADLAR